MHMYDYIVQMTSEPVPNEDCITANMYDDSPFVYQLEAITNPVPDADRRDILTAIFARPGLSYNPDSEKLTVTDKAACFERSYRAFRKEAEKLQNVTAEQYADTSLEMVMYSLQDAYDDRYGMYIADVDGQLCTLSAWMRSIHNGETFYVGGIVGYRA